MGHVRKVCNIGENVQCGRDSKSKRSSNLERAHWIPDLIEYIVRVLPSVICKKDREHGGCILLKYQGGAYRRTIGGYRRHGHYSSCLQTHGGNSRVGL